MDLHFHPLSGCSRRVLALLGHLEVPFTPKLVRLDEGAHKQADYLALNPNGKVPTLVDGELVLWESIAILRHLARQHRPTLLGEGAEMIEVDRWVAFGLGELSPALGRLNAATGLRVMRGELPDPVQLGAALADTLARLTVMEGHLAQQPWLAGARPTLAEFAVAPNMESSMALSPLTLADTPAVADWFGRCQALSGWPERVQLPSRG